MDKPVRRLAGLVLEFWMPRRCLICQKHLEAEPGELCPACRSALSDPAQREVRTGVHFRRCLSPLRYEGELRSSFLRYKFRGHWHYSHTYARWMWECLHELEPDLRRFDCVTWTPLSLPRRLRRGYDQAQRLSRGVARYSGLPLCPLLEKYRHTSPQSGTRDAAERSGNVRDVYRLRRGACVEGKRIVLVDDIITTGSTLEEASRVLREAGAAEICCLTLAHA